MVNISIFLTLFRLPVALFVTCSALTGHIAASRSLTTEMLFTAAGVFLLACGASALNQYQERDIDAQMERTRHRPLPAGILGPQKALIASLFVILAGLVLLGRSGMQAMVLGALAIAWYNGLYTCLKRRTAFAAVYGAPVGMLGPVIGWVAGNGSIVDPRCCVLALLFFLWQVPHFWMLLLRSGDDYDRAGLPSLTKVFPRELLSGITVLWTAAAASASLLLPLFGMVRTPALYGLLFLAALLSSLGAGWLTRKPALPAASFSMINGFIAAVMVLISADALLVR
jgi:protoheme IX farnesyltransferase